MSNTDERVFYKFVYVGSSVDVYVKGDRNIYLGNIHYSNKYNCLRFYPNYDTHYGADQLKEIADIVEEVNIKRRFQ
jgi:hypothetical protein